jgi:hypothetical protein
MKQCRLKGTEYWITKVEERNDMAWLMKQYRIRGTEYWITKTEERNDMS